MELCVIMNLKQIPRWGYVTLLLVLLALSWLLLQFSEHKRVTSMLAFEQFAYSGDLLKGSDVGPIFPSAPWQDIAQIPGEESSLIKGPGLLPYSQTFPYVRIKLARSIGAETEIWVRHYWPDHSFMVYHVESESWRHYPPNVEGYDVNVDDLFVTSDGTVWGQTLFVENTDLAPILSKFDESSGTFVSATEDLVVPLSLDDDLQPRQPHIVLDSEDTFWILIAGDGIYRFDTQSPTLTAEVTFQLNGIISFAIAPDDRIFVQTFSDTAGMQFFQLDVTQQELSLIEGPEDDWSYSIGFLVDRVGRLQVGSIGFRDVDGTWKLMHPDALEATRHERIPQWLPPQLVFESSDEILWYTEYYDMDLNGEGLAWYDRDTNQGELVTNLATFIVEDAIGRLWIVADGKLYSRSLLKVITPG